MALCVSKFSSVPFNVKADVCLTFVLIQIMLYEGYDVFIADHPSVAEERT